MEDFEKRMIIEYKELDERIDKLDAFLNYDENADKRKNICVGQLEQMHKQLEAMKAYREALCARLQMRGICFNTYDLNVLKGWHKLEDEKPKEGAWIIGFHHDWIDGDFNPEGIRIGFLQDNLASDDCPYDFVSAHWWDYRDDFITISKSRIEGNEDCFSEKIKRSIIPEYWIEVPVFKKS